MLRNQTLYSMKNSRRDFVKKAMIGAAGFQEGAGR